MYHFQVEVFIDVEDKAALEQGQSIHGANDAYSDIRCVKIIVPNTWVEIDTPDDEDDDDFLRYIVTPKLNR